MSASTFSLTDDQRSFRDIMRKFCDDQIAPHASEYDKAASYPWKSFEACKKMELSALGIPEEFGGAGADHVTQAIMVEELARA
jgi:alkylation response protein AidB-like acyl-CoA dehydrogenase